uniref:Uncharacterized protein n=1 Tax=Arion vulgaris TaxID=1028688 RepID=A0A0B7AF46_9EUPU
MMERGMAAKRRERPRRRWIQDVTNLSMTASEAGHERNSKLLRVVRFCSRQAT